VRRCLSVLAAVAVLACGCGPAGRTASLGSAPDFRLRTVDGESFQLAEHLGTHVVVMSFWTSFCSNCRAELTQMQRLYEELADRGLLVLAVALDSSDTISDVRVVRDRLGFTFPVLLDEESRVAARYNPRLVTPFTVMIDHAGDRVWSHEGFVPGDVVEIEATIRRLLDEMAAAAGSGGRAP
jgi:peroxiredoxin